MKGALARRGTRIAVIAALCAVVATSALAHGGDTSMIHGCVLKDTKYVRIVGANDNCKSNETALDWNAQGVPGAPGPRGPGVTEAQATTLAPGSAATAGLEAIPGDPEGDQKLLLGIPRGEKGDRGEAGSGIGSFSKVVVLNDDAAGNAAGWRPGGARMSFTISDPDADFGSLVIAAEYRRLQDGNALTITGSVCTGRHFFDRDEDLEVRADGVSIQCEQGTSEGSTLFYVLINP